MADTKPNKYIDENGVQWTYSRCFSCHENCGVVVGTDMETGEIVEIKPKEDEDTILCDRIGEKGINAIKFHYHPKRINHALKRVGERGEDKWEEISYDQALDEIATKLAALKEQYGPETLAVAEGTYRSDHLWARTRFTNLFGNPGNLVDPGTVCWCWTYTINMAMVGWPVEDLAPSEPLETGTLVTWGCRASEKYGPQSHFSRAMAMPFKVPGTKAKLINIDPVCTKESVMANHWLALYPGTDLIIAMAWINYIIEHDLYDDEFCTKWSNGVFLMRKDTNKLLRAEDVNPGCAHEDFVSWNSATDSIALWCSDKNAYYETGLDTKPVLRGNFEVTLADGTNVACRTVFDALAERASEYTLERASAISGVPETQIADAVYDYATNGPGFITWGIGGGDQHGYNATGMCVAKTILRIITGNLDIPGGEHVGTPGPLPDGSGEKLFPIRESEMELSEMVAPETREKFIGNDQFRVMSWKGFDPIDKAYRKMFDIPRPMVHQMLCSPTLVWDAILTEKPYPIKAMIAWSSNPLAWAPNTRHVYKALKELELLVVVDYWKTPTAALADYIMPAADWMERPFGGTSEDAIDSFIIGDRGSKPVADRRVDYDFFRGLGLRLGQEEYWPWEEYEEAVKYRVERMPGITYDQACEIGYVTPEEPTYYKHMQTLANGELRGFATMTRKAEMYPTLLEDLGYDPLPYYTELPETPLSNPELAKKYPLRLTVGGRIAVLYHSEQRVPGHGTRDVYPWPIVQINHEDARELGIRDGEWVWIETPRGRIRQKAKLDMGIVKGVVIAQASWWFPELPAEEPWSQGVFESNGNVLTDDAIETLDPRTASWVNRGLLCKVYPCIDPADRSGSEIPLEHFKHEETYYHKQFEHLGFAELTKKQF